MLINSTILSPILLSNKYYIWRSFCWEIECFFKIIFIIGTIGTVVQQYFSTILNIVNACHSYNRARYRDWERAADRNFPELWHAYSNTHVLSTAKARSRRFVSAVGLFAVGWVNHFMNVICVYCRLCVYDWYQRHLYPPQSNNYAYTHTMSTLTQACPTHSLKCMCTIIFRVCRDRSRIPKHPHRCESKRVCGN